MNELRTASKLNQEYLWHSCLFFVFLVVSCEEPDPLHHGNITVASHVFGSIANLSCADGYELDGNDTIECLSDGTWSTTNATCVSE